MDVVNPRQRERGSVDFIAAMTAFESAGERVAYAWGRTWRRHHGPSAPAWFNLYPGDPLARVAWDLGWCDEDAHIAAARLALIHACTYVCVAADHGDAICPIGRCMVDEGTYTASPIEPLPDAPSDTPTDDEDELNEEEP